MSFSSSLPAPLHELVARYLRTLATHGRAPGTITGQRMCLRHFVGFLERRGIVDVRRVAAADVEAYRIALARQGLAHESRYARHQLVRRFLRWLVSEGVLLADPAAACVPVRPRARLPRRVPSEGNMRRLLAAVEPATPIGRRDRAVLELLYSTGLRRAEVVALDLSDLDLTGGMVLVRRGKGGKGRLVPLGETAARAVLAYIQGARSSWITSPSTTALFLAASHCGQTGRRLSSASIRLTVTRAAARAGLGRITPHSLRHAMATHLVRAGADVRHVQEILGHARVSTTEVYAHLALRDLASVHARTHPRGGRPPL